MNTAQMIKQEIEKKINQLEAEKLLASKNRQYEEIIELSDKCDGLKIALEIVDEWIKPGKHLKEGSVKDLAENAEALIMEMAE